MLSCRADRASKLRLAASRFQNRLLFAAWTSWGDFVARRQAQREAAHHAVQHWLTASLRTGLEAFRANVQSTRAARAAVERWRYTSLAKGFLVGGDQISFGCHLW